MAGGTGWDMAAGGIEGLANIYAAQETAKSNKEIANLNIEAQKEMARIQQEIALKQLGYTQGMDATQRASYQKYLQTIDPTLKATEGKLSEMYGKSPESLAKYKAGIESGQDEGMQKLMSEIASGGARGGLRGGQLATQMRRAGGEYRQGAMKDIMNLEYQDEAQRLAEQRSGLQQRQTMIDQLLYNPQTAATATGKVSDEAITPQGNPGEYYKQNAKDLESLVHYTSAGTSEDEAIRNYIKSLIAEGHSVQDIQKKAVGGTGSEIRKIATR
jgi:hypothetical protein